MTPPTRAVTERLAELRSADLPAYLYDLTALREHVAWIRSVLPDTVEMYYAAKANPEPAILTTLHGIVDGFEVSSGGKLTHVAAAVPTAPLAFGGPGKTAHELTAAIHHGVHRIHVESEHELRVLAALAAARSRPIDVLLRVNLPVADTAAAGSALAMGGRATPFGMSPQQAHSCAAALTAGQFPHLRWRGVHAHLASGLDADDLVELTASIVEWARALARTCQTDLAEVNVGGGMNVDYAPDAPTFDWKTYSAGLARLTRASPATLLRIEPGRALTAYCGWYATDVLDVKTSHGTDFAIVRGGTHHLRTPAARAHSQPFSHIPVESWPHDSPRPACSGGPLTVTGQLCTPKDILAHTHTAATVRAGDRLVFGRAGAYAWNISHHDFLMHPAPTFHHLDRP
ncbi:type III PLP-dependent enzyme [Nocardia sp. NPDC052254]|uniref:type III PLP-dependent enzyme n=1 Tax=Nocardia sp. NPDC052254 TaxID=3155681 RepID=UPI003435F339